MSQVALIVVTVVVVLLFLGYLTISFV